MNKADYDRALYYTYLSQWDNLLILMIRTKDDFLSKRIEHFLHAYYYQKNDTIVEKHLYALLQYAAYANDKATIMHQDVLYSV
ncbi:YhdB family protein [Caldifermentibacillus hisashii]|uniref:YhdB family protein n=1 Tax=Caldifermentibacillus hisashii TaxID=996558 RepID=UPI001C11589D|nr:YhdB family protein [Caldifermentibacillus hisashii]MBU5341851.1 YhdB family protein [Caldifermentibacillus hisashii]